MKYCMFRLYNVFLGSTTAFSPQSFCGFWSPCRRPGSRCLKSLIHLDHGGEFENELFYQLDKLIETYHSRTTP